MALSGLGDLIALLTSLIGIHTTHTCGCRKRRDLLNKMVPFPDWISGRGRTNTRVAPHHHLKAPHRQAAAPLSKASPGAKVR